MPIAEIVKTVVEVAKETAKEMSKETKSVLKELDKPLNASEVNKTTGLKDNGLERQLKELDKPLNAENNFDNIPYSEKDETLGNSKDSYQNGSSEKFNSDNQEIDNSEVGEKQGGRFGDIYKEGEGDFIEVHHMPADSVTELPRNDGPAIRMSKEDHRETASCGNSREAREYREHQKELIEAGKFDEAVQMDIDDVQEKFGNKYDDAINQMLEYIDELKEADKI